MRRECAYCHRGYSVAGEESEGVTHGYCAKCLFCMQYEKEATNKGLSVSEYLDENPGLLADLKNILKDELNGKVVWEGSYDLAIDPDVEKLFNSYKRIAQSEIRSENRGPDSR